MTNQLYPAFFRLDRLQLLVVGAGAVGEEKLRFILKSSPNARVTVVAPWMGEELKALLDVYDKGAGPRVRGKVEGVGEPTRRPSRDEGADSSAEGVGQVDRLTGEKVDSDTCSADEPGRYASASAAEQATASWATGAGGNVTWYAREFRPADVDRADLVVAATDIRDVNHAVHAAAKTARRLCNIADTPELCDFYLGSIVTRGPLKVAISTNGQSPTFAKRFRQFLEAELPSFETTNLLDNLKVFRDRLTGDFSAKVRQLNAVTSNLLSVANATERGCACPPGECLVAEAGKADGEGEHRPSTSPAPAAAPAPEPAEGPQKEKI